MKKGIVYWIHLPEHKDPFTEGYIGVTTNKRRRWNQHKHSTKKAKLGVFQKVILKYTWEYLIKTTIFKGPEEGCYQLEEYFRADTSIGWNLVPGGVHSGVHKKERNGFYGKTHSKELKQKLSILRSSQLGLHSNRAKPANVYDYTTKELVESNVSLADFARRHKLSSSQLGRTAKADHSKPSSRTNKRHYKNYYAEYVTKC